MSWFFGNSEKQNQIGKIDEHLSEIAHLNNEAIQRDVHTIVNLTSILSEDQTKNYITNLKTSTENFLYSLTVEDLKNVNTEFANYKNSIKNKIERERELRNLRDKKGVQEKIDWWSNLKNTETKPSINKITHIRNVRIPQTFINKITQIYSDSNERERILGPFLNRHRTVCWDEVVRDQSLIDYLDYFTKEDYNNLNLDYLFKERCPSEPELLKKITELSKSNPRVWDINWKYVHSQYRI